MLVRRPFDYPRMNFLSAFRDLERMQREMDRFFVGGIGKNTLGSFISGVFPAINLSEDANNYYVRAELPGMQAEDLDISATGKGLSISGKRKPDSQDEKARYHRREREAGTFSRMIGLPGEVDPNKVEANLKDGILKVTIAKAEKAKPKKITVQ